MSGQRQSTPPSEHAHIGLLPLVLVLSLPGRPVRQLQTLPGQQQGRQAQLLSFAWVECAHSPTTLTAPARRPCLPQPPPRRVLSAEVYGLLPAAHDKSLFPSDHAAVKATIQLARKLPVELQGQEGQQQGQQGQQQGRQAGAGAASSSL